MAVVGMLHMSGAGALFNPGVVIDSKNPTTNIFDVRKYPAGNALRIKLTFVQSRLVKVAWLCLMLLTTSTTTRWLVNTLNTLPTCSSKYSSCGCTKFGLSSHLLIDWPSVFLLTKLLLSPNKSSSSRLVCQEQKRIWSWSNEYFYSYCQHYRVSWQLDRPLRRLQQAHLQPVATIDSQLALDRLLEGYGSQLQAQQRLGRCSCFLGQLEHCRWTIH